MIKIVTDRLVLREYKESDWESVHLYAEQAAILIYEFWGPNTIEETKAFIAKVIHDRKRKPRRAYQLCVTLASTGELIGACGFRINRKDRKRGNFGYIINPQYWNQGHATEAAKALLNFMVENHGISVIEATCDAMNLASKKVLHKCGLRQTEQVSSGVEMKGRVRHTLYFERIVEDKEIRK